jgi:diacylglycerol kinase
MEIGSAQQTGKKPFSFTKRAKSFTYAFRGIGIFFKDTHNAWIHATAFVVALVLGIYFRISLDEWAVILLSSGLVFVSEAFNTALEVDLDLTSPDYHPYARDAKDIAVGAVLLSATTALIVGMFIFIPRIVGL